jgi:3-hydroxyacyl-CoA dehydrogenase
MSIRAQARDGVLVVHLVNPPVNAMSHELRVALAEALERAESDPSIEAVVLAGDGKHFSGGADIRGFGKPHEPPGLPDLIASIEGGTKRYYAAIDGTAFGGGFEIALACDARYATPSSKVGLPEINLGLLPGAGGTQRLPRLIGIGPAIDVITGGAPLSATRALELGALDGVVEGDVVAATIEIARAERGRERRHASARTAAPAPDAVAAARKRFEPVERGGLAAHNALAAIEASTLPFAEGLARERDLFVELLSSEQSRSRIHLFFAERQAAKVPDIPAGVAPLAVERVLVIGAGTMGGGIAMALADGGLQVDVVENAADALARGRATIEKNYAATASKGRISQAEVAARLGRMSFGTDLAAAAARADLVIEAVFEELGVKREVFATLDRVCRPGTLLASNTSTLDIDAIASATSRPGDVIGLHFFSPANVMKLLEIVRGTQTSPEAIVTAFALAKRIRKVGVLARSCDGFIGNRMLAGYGREANYLIEEGALPQDVDRAIKAFGFPMGIFAMGDLAGLDVGWRIRKRRLAEGKTSAYRESGVNDLLCERGWFGQKSGRGFYRYEAGSRVPQPDPEVEALIRAESQRLGVVRRTISDDEIVLRCMLPLVNEGANILLDGTAIRASDIDVVWVYGYGFPAFRGGPMHWADHLGLANVRDEIRGFERRYGERWKLSPLIEELASAGRSFAEFTPGRSPVTA